MDSSITNRDGSSETNIIYKSYGIRWLILLLFVSYSMSNAFQWIQYSIITNIITFYYGVSTSTVNWLSMMYMICYIPLVFPASWYLEKQGLRRSILIGSFGTVVGSWIKCGSIDPSRFWVTALGQLFASISNVFILGIPPRLAAVWFSADQVSTACAIGVLGNQLGIALGFLLPPLIVPDSTDLDEISHGLAIMFYGIAVICTVVFILILVVFKEAPETPPSAAAQSALEENSGSYVQGIVRLMKNRNYVLLLITYGMNVGIFYAISTLLNQMILDYFPGHTKSAGQIGLLIVLSGMVGSIVCGYILDKTSKFKIVTVGIYVMSALSMIAYTFILELQILWLVFIMAVALGFSMTGYLPVGFEFAAELTFPEPEGTSSGLLNLSAQIISIVFIVMGGKMMEYVGDRSVNLVFCVVLLIGSVMTFCITEELRRQDARKKELTIDEVAIGPRV